MKKVFSFATISQILVTAAAVFCLNILSILFPFLNVFSNLYFRFAVFVEKSTHTDIFLEPFFLLVVFPLLTGTLVVFLCKIIYFFYSRHVRGETKSKLSQHSKNRLGSRGVLLYFLCWGFFGFFLSVGLVIFLKKAWQEILGTIPDKIPPGIMIAGSLGGFIAVFLCAFVGIAIGSYRARQWGGKPALIAGVLGPVLGCLGCIVGAFLGGPKGWFVGAPIGMVLGVNIGRELGVGEKNTNKIGPDTPE